MKKIQDNQLEQYNINKLIDSASHYRKLVENSQNLICQHNEAGLFQFVSPSVSRILGFTIAELLETSIFDLLHPDDQSDFEIAFTQAQDSPRFISRHRLINKTGTYQWFETQLFPLKNNHLNAIQASYREITQRIAIEEKEMRTYKIFKTLFNNINVGHAIIDKNGRYIKVNQTWAENIGYLRNELTLKYDWDFTHPADHQLQQDQFKKLLKGESVRFVKRMITSRQQHIWVDMSFVPLKTHDDQLDVLVGCMVDITQQKSNAQSVLHSEKNYRLIVDNVTDVISKHSLDGTYEYITPSSFKLIGYKPQELVGLNSLDFVYSKDKHIINKAYRQLIIDQQPQVVCFRVRHKDNSIKWVEATSRLIKDLDNEPQILCVTRDINLRKETENKLRESEKQLKAKNRELTKVNQELDQFAYRTSHDLKAPLSSIRGLIDLMGKKLKDPQDLDYLRLIQKSAQKLDYFVFEILQFSRNSRGEVIREKIHFRELLEEIFDGLKYAEDSAVFDKTLEISDQLTSFYNDVSRLKMILSNLISNSIRYKKPYEKLQIQIRIKVSPKEAIIQLSDNGIGIARAHQEKVFQMFYRANDRNAGSGLGLFIVKEALIKLNGSISLNSELGIGTSFTIKIPNLDKSSGLT